MVSICCPIKLVSSSVVICWAALFARMIRRDRSIKNKASEKISAAFFNIAAVAVGSEFRLLLLLRLGIGFSCWSNLEGGRLEDFA